MYETCSKENFKWVTNTYCVCTYRPHYDMFLYTWPDCSLPLYHTLRTHRHWWQSANHALQCKAISLQLGHMKSDMRSTIGFLTKPPRVNAHSVQLFLHRCYCT